MKKQQVALAAQLIGMIEQARREVLKPQVWDWRKDVSQHLSFTKLVQGYHKTKSQKELKHRSSGLPTSHESVMGNIR